MPATSRAPSARSASTISTSGARGRHALLTLLAIMGPGLIVMVGDNDAGGVATYARRDRTSGSRLLWTLPLLIPVLVVNQEMVVRLGAVTGVGHARLINERFGRFWGAFSVGDLFILNFLTIATEFIGVSLALGYFGVSEYVSVPIAAVALVAMTATGSFRRWERFMFVFIVANFLVDPPRRPQPSLTRAFAHGFVTSGVTGGFNFTSVLLDHRHRGHDGGPLAAVLPAVQHRGQAHHPPVDQLRAGRHRARVSRHRLRRSVADGGRGLRVRGILRWPDTSPTPAASPAASTTSSGTAARGPLRHHPAQRVDHRGRLGDPVHLATPSATSSGPGTRCTAAGARPSSSTAPSPAMVAAAAIIVLIPGAPLGLITTGVQALAGVLLPERHGLPVAPLQRQAGARTLGQPAVAQHGGQLDRVRAARHVARPHGDHALLPDRRDRPGEVLGGVLVVGLPRGRSGGPLDPGGAGPAPPMPMERRATWRMPALNLLERPTWSRGRLIGMYLLRGYLVVAVLLLLVKAIELGVHH